MASIQLKTFTKNYSKLCTITDISNLLPHFVTKEIINLEDAEKITNISTSSVKVQKLLTHVAGPLQAGNTQPYYTMLIIMEQYGTQATRTLATQIRNQVCEPISGMYI